MTYQSIYKFHAFRIVFIYAIFGTTWILFSDSLMFHYVPEFKSFSLMKGMFYIIFTSFLLLYLLKYSWGEIDEAQKKLHTFLHTDPLTKLHNRIALQSKIEFLVQEDQTFCLLFINADRFKTFNEQYGHLFGDELLRQMANRMTDIAPKRNAAYLARWGADEFILVLKGIDKNTVKEHTLSLQMQLQEPMIIFNQKVSLTFSLGCSFYPEDAHVTSDCIRFSELALHEAKSEGGRTIVYYHNDLSAKALNRFELENGLKMAIPNNELFVVYQPQISALSGELIGYEALLRWKYKEKLISPAEFIPIAEESGLIVPIGEFVIQSSCRQLLHLNNQGYKDIVMSINVSSRQFYQLEFVNRLLEIVINEKVNPNQIMIEITESIIMESTSFVMESLNKLREAGFQIAIDDFGTGYSSFKYLEELPLDLIKIDQSFTQSLHKTRTRAIVQSIVSLAHNLQLEVLAEGVETLEQSSILQEMECHYLQGYYYGRPDVIHTVTPFLKI